MYLETLAACEVAGIHRDRFNEHVAAGHFKVAPSTVQGRARRFTPDDVVALCLFQDLMLDGWNAVMAGRVAGIAAAMARLHRRSARISVVRYNDMGGRLVASSFNGEDVLQDEAAVYAMVFNMDALRERVSAAFQDHFNQPVSWD